MSNRDLRLASSRFKWRCEDGHYPSVRASGAHRSKHRSYLQPCLIVLITGKGPLRAAFEKSLRDIRMKVGIAAAKRHLGT